MESPNPGVGAVHVAVGVNVVWAVTKDHKASLILYKQWLLSNLTICVSMLTFALSSNVQ